jgi:hypothetical protein
MKAVLDLARRSPSASSAARRSISLCRSGRRSASCGRGKKLSTKGKRLGRKTEEFAFAKLSMASREISREIIFPSVRFGRQASRLGLPTPVTAAVIAAAVSEEAADEAGEEA